MCEHRASWGGRADFPALELGEIARFVDALERRPRAIWLRARAACALVRAARHGQKLGLTGAASATGLALALLTQRRGRLGLAALAAPLRRRALRASLPWLSRMHFLPSIFF